MTGEVQAQMRAHRHQHKRPRVRAHTRRRTHAGDVSLELEGACGNCPSSSVTLKMGIERALREQFGDRLGQVNLFSLLVSVCLSVRSYLCVCV